VIGALLATLVLGAAGAPPPPPATAGGGVAVTGVGSAGVSGTVRTQSASGGGVVLGVNGAEVRVTPWPEPGKPPRLVGLSLVATVDRRPEGPEYRVELGPEKGPVRWVIGSGTYGRSNLASRFSLGAPAVETPDEPRVPVLDQDRILTRLGAGAATVLADGKARWCLRIVSVTIPKPRPGGGPEIADAPTQSRVDFVLRRLQGKKEGCSAATGGR
jgi:hypothetical protein